MKKEIFFFVALIAMGSTINAQEQATFQPSGKTIMRIFSNFNSEFTDGTTNSAFELERAYLGYQYEFTENFSSTVLFDITVPKNENSEFTLHVKNAYLNYKNQNLNVTFGMIPTLQVKLQEDFWGYRYLLKSHQDLSKMISTADIGLSASYSIIEKIVAADLSIINGETYKHIQADNNFKTAFGVTVHPIKDLTLRAVYDFMGTENAQTSFISFIGYQFGKNTIAAEYNIQQNVNYVPGKDYWGTSVYATLAPFKNIEVFARYDFLTSNTINLETSNWNASNDGRLIVAGVEYQPIKGLKITPNYRLYDPSVASETNTHSIYMNVEVRF